MLHAITVYGDPWREQPTRHPGGVSHSKRAFACHTDGCTGHYERIDTGLYWCRTCNVEVAELLKHGERQFIPVPKSIA